MKKVILSFATLCLIVSVTSCRNTETKAEETTESVEAVMDDTMEATEEVIEATTDTITEAVEEVKTETGN